MVNKGFKIKNLQTKFFFIVLTLLLSMQAYAAESGTVTAKIVDTEAVMALEVTEINSEAKLGVNTFSDLESAVKDYKTIRFARLSPSDIEIRVIDLEEAAEVVKAYATDYLVSVVEFMQTSPGLPKERIFNEATSKVMNELSKIDSSSWERMNLSSFIDTSIFQQVGPLGPDGKIIIDERYQKRGRDGGRVYGQTPPVQPPTLPVQPPIEHNHQVKPQTPPAQPPTPPAQPPIEHNHDHPQ